MAWIVDIDEGRRRIAAKRGFAPWSSRFGTSFDGNTSVRLLEDPVIGYLVRGSEDSILALHELIMATRGLGAGIRFNYLDSRVKLEVTDVVLFLLDMIRFEAMYRIGWLEDYSLLNVPLIDLIMNFKQRFAVARESSPVLSRSHQLYRQYLAEYEADRNVFLRKLIPEAIKTFCNTALQLE
jgi:hypothetical protein